MALMARSKHKTNKGRNSRPHPKNPKRQHTTTTLQARGGVRLKAARKVERETGVSAMQTEEGPSDQKREKIKSTAGFKVRKGKLNKGKVKKAALATIRQAGQAVASSRERGGDDGDDFEGMLAEDTNPEEEGLGIPTDLFEDNLKTTVAPTPQTANQKKKAKQKQRIKKKSALEFEASRSVAATISEAEPFQQAAWLWQSFCAERGTDPAQSSGLDGASIVRLSGAGDFEQQLKALAGNAWHQELATDQGRPAGSPSVLLMSASAAVANDLIKLLPTLNRSCKVAKLFARHFKLIEQQTLLTNQAPAIAVGTPHRLQQLADIQALKLGKLGLVLIDVALDAKQRTVMDIPETRKDFWALFQAHLGPLVVGGQTRIALFDSDRYKA